MAQRQEKLLNWAGNLTYGTHKLLSPQSTEEAAKIVRQHRKLKVLGSRHSFNTIADSTDSFISLMQMNKVLELDEKHMTVTVGGGMNYGELCPYLQEKGFALHNLASLPHISIAGACSTATHGSGTRNGNLATAVVGMEMVLADGSVVSLPREKDAMKFDGMVVGLGALGVITRITLSMQKTFQVKQTVFEGLPFSEFKNHFDAIISSGYSVSLFTDWKKESFNEVWIKQRSEESKLQREFYGAKTATKNLHPIAETSPEHCTEQLDSPGPWFERLPHFKMGFTPSSGKELQSEYFVSRENAVDAILAVARLHNQISPLILISEIRSIAADSLWMSPCFHQPSIAIHFTWKQDEAVLKLLPIIEKELEPYGAKPHWGKLFTTSSSRLEQLHEKLNDFKSLVRDFDPSGKFRNAWLGLLNF